MSDSKFLVTGASGFIGTALCDAIRKSGFEVSVINHEDLPNLKHLKELVSFIQPDYIFHLSSYGNHSDQINHWEMMMANIGNLMNLFEASKDIPYKAFINFGSSSEYGDKATPMSERDVLDATSMYGCTKAAGTQLARAFAKQYNKPIVTVRPFSVYGPGEADFRFIPHVAQCLLYDETLKLDPYAKHDWIYIDDFLDGVLQVAELADLFAGQVINIGTGLEVSNQFIANVLEKLSGKTLKVEEVGNLRPNDSKTWVADNGKLKSTGWKPKHTLIQGLRKTFKHYKRKYGDN